MVDKRPTGRYNFDTYTTESKMTIPKAKQLAQEAAVYVPFNGEAIRIDNYNENNFCGTGEESGVPYTVPYEYVDLDNDMFYKLVLMDNNQ